MQDLMWPRQSPSYSRTLAPLYGMNQAPYDALRLELWWIKNTCVRSARVVFRNQHIGIPQPLGFHQTSPPNYWLVSLKNVQLPPTHTQYSYLVLGLFGGKSPIPRERLINIKQSKWLFWKIWLAQIQLRGFRYFFSLKHLRAFRKYEVERFYSFYSLQRDAYRLYIVRLV